MRVASLGRHLGRYEVLLELASGGMGTVSVGRLKGPSGFKRLVAIKTIHAHLSANEEYAQMLVREADLASRLDHPNVIPVIEFGSERGQLFLVMDYYPSVPLSEVMRGLARNQQKMPLGHAIGFAMDAAAGLEAAHNLTSDDDGQCLGIVHRDVTPSNLLVGADGMVRVTDFGLAKAHATTVESITSDSKMVKGKLAYLSPEQATCESLDRRSDVFTLGIVLYEMVAGRRLFAGDNDLALLRSILDMPIPSARSARPECPEILAEVISKALERDAGQRYHSAAEFRDALQLVAREISDVGRSSFVERLVGHHFVERKRAIAAAEAESDAISRSIPPPPPPTLEMDELEVSESDIIGLSGPRAVVSVRVSGEGEPVASEAQSGDVDPGPASGTASRPARASGRRMYRIIGVATIANVALVIGAVLVWGGRPPAPASGGLFENVSQFAAGARARIVSSTQVQAPVTELPAAHPVSPVPVPTVRPRLSPPAIVRAAERTSAAESTHDASAPPPVTPETGTATLEM